MRPERPEAHRLDERVKILILRERVGLTQGAIKTENSRSLSRPPPRPGRPPPAPAAPAWRWRDALRARAEGEAGPERGSRYDRTAVCGLTAVVIFKRAERRREHFFNIVSLQRGLNDDAHAAAPARPRRGRRA